MRKVVKYSVWTVGVILLLPLLVLFLLYLPPVQDLVKDKALASVSERTGMVLEAGTFRFGFPLEVGFGRCLCWQEPCGYVGGFAVPSFEGGTEGYFEATGHRWMSCWWSR